MKLDVDANSSVLVIVPHEDDELNIAGGFLPLLVENNIVVKVLFMINGDFKVEAATRYHEARAAMNAVGIPKENVFFLGYPDVTDESAECSLYRTKEAINSYLGNTSYGVVGIPEYRMQRDGSHSPCSYEGMLKDLEDFLLDMRADIILAIDFDHHHDHRLCTLAFEQTIEKILLTAGNTYVPEIYKCFAYSTAYEAPKDFYNLNLLPVPKPNKVRLSQAPETELENPFYLWKDRVRFPISESSSVVPLRKNIMYAAVREYRSQLLVQTAQKMVNSDVLAWKRETEYIPLLGKISASSGDGEILRKFSILDAKDISNFGRYEQPVEYLDRAWIPDVNDKNKAISYEFKKPVSIDKIVIYQAVNIWAKQFKVEVIFDNGFKLEANDFLGHSRTYTANFELQKAVKKITICFSNVEEEFGINLIEFGIAESRIRYAKICLDGNFAYGTYFLNSEKEIHLQSYLYGIKGNFIWKLDGQVIGEGKLNVENLKKSVLSLYMDNILYDSVTLIRLSAIDKAVKKYKFFVDKCSVYMQYKLMKWRRKELKREKPRQF